MERKVIGIADFMRCNEQIRISPVRLIDENNVQVGVVSTDEALRRAREAGQDLVEVAPKERPPVCRIMDYGKWKYQQKKNVKKHHEQLLKEVRLRARTDDHDREIKVARAREFLSEGHKVQFTMQFRGRERVHHDIGLGVFHNIVASFGELAKIEREPRLEGRRMIMVLAPGKVPAKPAKPAAKPESAPSAAPARPATAPPEPAPGAAVTPPTGGAAPPPADATSAPSPGPQA